MFTRLTSLVPVLSAVTAVGCVADDLAPDTAEVVQLGVASCPIWQCGSNSPHIANNGFHELQESGLTPNAEGFQIVSFSKGNVAYGLDVRDGRLLGIDLATSEVAISARQGNLNGAQLRIHHSSGSEYLIRVTTASTNGAYWANRGVVPAPTFESYLLEWSHVGLLRWHNVCGNPSPSNPENLTLNGYHSVVFDGERINAAAKTISTALAFDWFNIGCAGHALAKLHLTGHTEAAMRAGAFVTSIPERQTMLKMVTADYCGTGKPYTVAGQELSWKDHKGWMGHPLGALSIEARWTPAGASCLETPRVTANPTALGDETFGSDVRGVMMLDGCRIRSCSVVGNTDPHQLAGHHLVSANPTPVQ